MIRRWACRLLGHRDVLVHRWFLCDRCHDLVPRARWW